MKHRIDVKNIKEGIMKLFAHVSILNWNMVVKLSSFWFAEHTKADEGLPTDSLSSVYVNKAGGNLVMD